MASRSPIVLNSSSRASSLGPSVTPQSHRNISNIAESSSPGLRDLPTFASVPAKGLKSGSRVQNVPEGATFGFASAATIWKANKEFDAKRDVGEQQDERHLATRDGKDQASLSGESSGKLPKLSKMQKPRKDRKPLSVESSSFLPENTSHHFPGVSKPTVSPAPSLGRTRKPSISLSEYDFPSGEHPLSPLAKVVPQKPPKQARSRTTKEGQEAKGDISKKPRKRASKTDVPSKNKNDVGGKRPKKRLAKSESIILNSDEPDAVVDGESTTTLKSPLNDTRIEHFKNSGAGSTAMPDRQEKSNSASLELPVHKTVEDEVIVSAGKSDKSVYFSKAAPMVEDNADNDPSHDSGVQANRENTAFGSPIPMAASRRRLSWTPAKNTARTITTPKERPGTASSTGSEAPPKSLAMLVSGFGYTDREPDGAPHQRTATGEALTKKRRIELADASTVAPSKRVAANSAPSESTKKPKVKKKPQTITALATKAYLNEPDVPCAQATVSEFFPAAQPNPSPDSVVARDTAKPKKPRKPRAKKTGDGVVAQTSKRTTKPKKAKVKFDEAQYLAKLYTPDEARAQGKKQDFLFGTSSQLAVEESPNFLREMQAAIRESEATPVPQLVGNSHYKSCTRVPSAPNGTSLSIGQADRDHWSTAARDESGDFLEMDTIWERHGSVRGLDPAGRNAVIAESAHEQASVDGDNVPEPVRMSSEQAPRPDPRDFQQSKPDDTHQDADDSNTIDLCQTSPAVDGDESPADGAAGLPEATVSGYLNTSHPLKDSFAPIVQHHHSEGNESWALLSSDDSPHRAADDNEHDVLLPPRSPLATSYVRPPQLMRSTTSPSVFRAALRSLDANVGLNSHTSPTKGANAMQQRALTTSAAVDQAKRPRGRPRKNAALTSPTVSSPKRPGRPPKTSGAAAGKTASPKGRRSRKAPMGISASQPTESTAWANIDEISDSDSPTTPSPPRRRASSSPPATKPLDVSIAASPSLKAKAPAAVSSTLKANDPNFSDIQGLLFPQITATVRSTPPSTDIKNPTWHEKILLYDPIVLEDLTAWLNEQGVRIDTRRLKQKPKTKGRKKKDAEDEDPEYELAKEELKPWMVQKWCEEKSICCLWKEGLRGGVRTRY